MPVINILSPHVADMIAAGEVVERPASVIKELVENSFDAGARNITVAIEDGGATCIRVTDDGCGMAPEDAGVAFLRHATSKLRDERGLEAISTMGFRGEALAAISAVSEIELTTRRRGDREGTRVTLTAGDIQDMGPWGCPEGSTMTVRRLFFNTPARLKFLKSDRSEASACIQAALRCALGHPEVSLRFLRDGKEEFFSPGDGRMDSCVYALLGRDVAKDLLPCESQMDNMRIRGFVSSPAAGRGNRGAQYFYCNGRYIKSALLQSAVEQAYKNTLLTGRYPACVLYLELGYGSVDVNVHPAKTEVKFSAERQVFDLVYHAVLSALAGERPCVQARPAPEAKAEKAAPKADFYRSMSAKEFRDSGYSVKSAAPTTKSPSATAVITPPAPRQSIQTPREEPSVFTLRAPQAVLQTSLDLPPAAKSEPLPPIPTPEDRQSLGNTGFSTPDAPKAVENSVQNVERLPLPDHKIVGEALKTYIIVEQGEALIFIDKHAAHERMIFDRLKQQERQIMSQGLLCPVTLRVSGEDGELLEKNGQLLSDLGFELEPFGENEYILRAVPADMLPEDAKAAVEEICEKLRRGKAPDPAAARDEILHTVACKAAIKAGWDTDEKELQRLVEAVLSGQVKYCPHGRPVSVTMTRKELDKQFKRIV
ncbi:MAG: DNA mismatch repair endonuclease MutL [Candidatus Limivicinus sp.]